jgi:hypothetical protein
MQGSSITRKSKKKRVTKKVSNLPMNREKRLNVDELMVIRESSLSSEKGQP